MQKINEQPIYYNYKRENKWFGIIDYKSLIAIVIYVFIIGYVLSVFSFNLEIKVYIFMALTVPVIAISCVNVNNESIIDVFVTILKFEMKNNMFINENNFKDMEKYDKAIYENRYKMNK